MKNRFCSSLVCLLTLIKVVIVATKHPAITLSVNQEGLEKIQYQYIQSITSKLKPIMIDKHFDTKVALPFIGEVVLKIDKPEIKIHEIKPDQIDYTFLPLENAINLKLKNFSADVIFNLYLLTGFVELDTTATLTLNDFSINIEFTTSSLETVRNGEVLNLPGFQLRQLYFLDEFWFNLSFTSEGPIESLLSFLAGSATGTVKDVLNDLYNELIIETLNPILNQLFEHAGNMFKIPKPDSIVEYSLFDNFKYHGESLEISMIIELLDKNKMRFSRTEGSTMPSNIDTKGVLIYINQNIIDDAIGGAYTEELIKTSVGYDNFYNQKTNSSILNTTTFMIIDGMSIYPPETPMYVDCIAYKNVPKLSLKKDASKAFFGAKCGYIVKLNSKTNSTAFTVYLAVESDFDLKIKAGTLFGMISQINLVEVEQINSESTIDVDVGIIIFLFSFTTIIENLVNKYLQDTGVQIPIIDGMSFSESSLEIWYGYIKLELIPVFNALPKTK